MPTGGYQILQDGDATQVATYISDSWKIDRWLLDASVRLAHISLSQETSNLSPSRLGTQFDLWDIGVELPTARTRTATQTTRCQRSQGAPTTSLMTT